MKNDVAKSILMQMPGMASNIVAGGFQHRARQAQMNAARAQQESQFQREMQRLRDQAAHKERIENQDAAWNEWQRNLARPGMEIEARNAPDIAEAKRRIAMADAESKGLDVTLKRDTLPWNVEAARINAESGQDDLNRGRDLHPLNKQWLSLRNRSMQQEMKMREQQSRAAEAAVESMNRLYSSGVPEHMRVDIDDADKPESLQKLRQLGRALPKEDQKQFNEEVQRVADTALLKRRLNKNFDELQKIYDARKGNMNFDPVRDAAIIKKIQAISATNQSVVSGLLAREPSQTLQAKFYGVGDPAEWSSVIPGMLGVHRSNLMNHIDVVSSKATPILSSVNAFRERPQVEIFDSPDDDQPDNASVATNPFFGMPGFEAVQKLTR